MTATMTGPEPTMTEVGCAADTLVALLAARLVPANRAMEACRVVGIAWSDLDDARIRAQLGRTRPPRHAEMLPTLTTTDFARRPSDRAFRGTNGSHHDGTVPKATKKGTTCSSTTTAGAVAASDAGRIETPTGAGQCSRHVDPNAGLPPWDRTFAALFGRPCPQSRR